MPWQGVKRGMRGRKLQLGNVRVGWRAAQSNSAAAPAGRKEVGACLQVLYAGQPRHAQRSCKGPGGSRGIAG